MQPASGDQASAAAAASAILAALGSLAHGLVHVKLALQNHHCCFIGSYQGTKVPQAVQSFCIYANWATNKGQPLTGSAMFQEISSTCQTWHWPDACTLFMSAAQTSAFSTVTAFRSCSQAWNIRCVCAWMIENSYRDTGHVRLNEHSACPSLARCQWLFTHSCRRIKEINRVTWCALCTVWLQNSSCSPICQMCAHTSAGLWAMLLTLIMVTSGLSTAVTLVLIGVAVGKAAQYSQCLAVTSSHMCQYLYNKGSHAASPKNGLHGKWVCLLLL